MSINWRKSVFVACDIIIAAYLLLAVTAFNKPDVTAMNCSEVTINIEQNAIDGFMNAEEIKKALTKEKAYPL